MPRQFFGCWSGGNHLSSNLVGGYKIIKLRTSMNVSSNRNLHTQTVCVRYVCVRGSKIDGWLLLLAISRFPVTSGHCCRVLAAHPSAAQTVPPTVLRYNIRWNLNDLSTVAMSTWLCNPREGGEAKWSHRNRNDHSTDYFLQQMTFIEIRFKSYRVTCRNECCCLPNGPIGRLVQTFLNQ